MKLVEIDPGDDVVQALAAHPSSWITANGHVEGVEVRLPSEASDVTRALRGRWTLVSLMGSPPGPLTASLARSTDTGLELLGGVLVKARSAGVLAHVQRTERDDALESEKPQQKARREAPLAPREAMPEPMRENAWSQVAAASNAKLDAAPLSHEDDDGSDPNPAPGDRVDHFSFGLCEVLMSDGERLKIRDLKGPGRIREIALSALIVERTKSNGPQRGFRLLRRT